MKVLFVCYANAMRSQMAAAFYNRLTGANDATSAGVGVPHPEYAMGELAKKAKEDGMYGAQHTIDVMREVGIDISNEPRTKLAPETFDSGEYDIVVDINEPSRRESWLTGDNVIWWDIFDPRGHGTREQVLTARNEIESHVKKLIEVINSSGDFHELDDNIDKEEN